MRQLNDDLLVRDPSGTQDRESVSFRSPDAYVVVAQEHRDLVGIGGFDPLDSKRAEIKRLYVVPNFRRQGRCREILRNLETEISRRGFEEIVVETGFFQPEGVAFYLSEGYTPVGAFGAYANNGRSRCFRKQIKQAIPAALQPA